jgi:surfactin synthase thioesterase subunit
VAEYLRWSDHLPDVEVLGVQLPGRGSRWEERPLTRMEDVVSGVVQQVAFEGRFAFFGHSLGAWIAFEVARGLSRAGRTGPEALFVSAAPGPQCPRRRPPISALPDEALLKALMDRYGRGADDVLNDPELREMVMPGLRADLAITETYRFLAGVPLAGRIVALSATEDDVSIDDVALWRLHTRGGFAIHTFPGDHYYVREQRDAVLRLIRTAVLQEKS